MERKPVLVDLALQGGGSHGAFTWGVLDRLLEEPWLKIDGISGTSAGAMNAAVLVDGLAKGGAEGARTALENFWRRVSHAARFSPLRRGPLDVILGRWTLDSSPIYVAMDLMSRMVSPYDLNPMGKNPLRAILAETIDFGRLARAPIKLFITATNVRTGRGHVFKNDAITPEVLRLISEIDEFKGAWAAIGRISPDRLTSLRRVATIESIGSSTRIEGAKLSDKEVERLLSNLEIKRFA